MRDFSEQSCKEGLENIYALLSRTLLLRDSKPVDSLVRLLEALNYADMLLAARCYHDMVSALLLEPARRVSGDIWCDYLLYMLLETPHPFACMAAKEDVDEAVYEAMCSELSILGTLSTLTGTVLVRMLRERQRELQLKTRQVKDDISLFSTALWSGVNTRPLPKDTQTPQNAVYVPNDLAWFPWHYGGTGLRDSYVSDEALEEIYARLLSSSDWRAYAEDLKSFFGAYGCETFIRARAFHYEAAGDTLSLLPTDLIAPLPEPVFYPDQHERIVENTLCFMQGDPAWPLLLTGSAGCGKTTQVLSLLYEFPELRLVVTDTLTQGLLERLGAQPLRFVVLVDDPERVDTRVLLAGRAVPQNILIYITCREEAQSAFATAMRVEFPPAPLREFSAFVFALLEAQNILADEGEVRSACVDWQMDTQNRLTVSAALQIAYAFSLSN